MHLLNKILRIFYDDNDTPGLGTPKLVNGKFTGDESKAFDLPDAEEESSEEESKTPKKASDKGEEKDEESGEESDEESSDESDKDDDTSDGGDEEDDDGESTEEESGEDEEDGEDELEEDTVYQAIKKHDKTLFKKIPGLRAAIFRDQQFSQFFSTPEEAKEVFEAAKVLSAYEQDLKKGNSEPIFKFLSSDKKSLEAFAANLLPELGKVDKDLLVKVMAPEFKRAIKAAIASGEKNMQISAKNMHWFLFGHNDLDRDEGIEPKKKDSREEELNERERQIQERQFKSFSEDVVSTSKKRVMKIIGKRFEESGLPELTKKHLTDEIYTRIVNSLDRDVRHKGNMNRMWRKAVEEGFTSDGKDSLISAFLSRAKVLISPTSQKVLSEAKIDSKGDNGSKTKPKRVPAGGSSSGGSKKKFDPKGFLNTGKTERDVFDGNF